MNFPERLKKLRTEAGLSQKKLAEELGFSQASIGYWEKGERTPSIEAVMKIAEYFHISVDQLIDLPVFDVSKIVDRVAAAHDITPTFPEIPPKSTRKIVAVFRPRNSIKRRESAESNTLAAHFTTDEFTEDELEEIRQFAEFVKNRKKNKEND